MNRKDTIFFGSWDNIRYFIAVAKAGSLNAASKNLGVDHTTVGRRLKAFEGSLEAALFDRCGNGLRLTADGQEALGEAVRVQELIDAFAQKVHGSNRRLAGEVRLNVTEGLASFWLMPQLQPFQQANPKLNINWFISNSESIELGRDVDIAIRWRQPTEPDAVGIRLGQIGYSLFAFPEYVERFGIPETIRDMAQHHFIHYNAYETNPHFAAWNILMRQFEPGMRLENSALTQAALKTGNFIALLPNYASNIEPALVRFPLDLDITIPIWLVYYEARRRSARVRALLDEIQRLFSTGRGTWFD